MKEECAEMAAVGDVVLNKIKALKLPAEPPNYELLYHHAIGDNPHLSRAWIDAETSGDPVEGAVELAERFFPRRQLEGAVEALGVGISDEIAVVVRAVDLALSRAAGRHVRLEQVLQTLAVSNAENVRVIVATLIETAAEIGSSTRQLEAQLQKSRERIGALRNELEEVSNSTLTDSLTSLRNRKGFDQELSRRIAGSSGVQQPFSLLMIDIDHFKSMNDKYGHQLGDQVIKLVAAIIKQSLRDGDYAARYGGEEFAVLTGDTAPAAAASLAETIRCGVRGRQFRRRSTNELLGTITVSIGIATWSPGEDREALVHRADTGLYRAKRFGRDRVEI